jgi:hypothetical protein
MGAQRRAFLEGVKAALTTSSRVRGVQMISSRDISSSLKRNPARLLAGPLMAVVSVLALVTSTSPAAAAKSSGAVTVAAAGSPCQLNVYDDGGLFALTPDRGAVNQGSSTGVWQGVGGPASTLYSGRFGLFATNPSTGDLYGYNNSPFSWTWVGGPGAEFAVTATGLFGLSPSRDAVLSYDQYGRRSVARRAGSTVDPPACWPRTRGPAMSTATSALPTGGERSVAPGRSSPLARALSTDRAGPASSSTPVASPGSRSAVRRATSSPARTGCSPPIRPQVTFTATTELR